MTPFGPPRAGIKGQDYSVAIRGPILTDAIINRYILAGHYGESARLALLSQKKKPTKRTSSVARALSLLDV